MLDINCVPLSLIILRGMPYLRNISSNSILAQVSAVASFSANNSTQRLAVSSIMNMCLNPSLVSGSGPNKAIAITSNL